MSRGMSCSCELGDDAKPINWCAAHARVYREAVEAEREACARIADKIETDAGYAIEGLNTYGANTKAAVAGIAINGEPMAEPKEIELRLNMLQTQAAYQTAAMQIASYIRSRK